MPHLARSRRNVQRAMPAHDRGVRPEAPPRPDRALRPLRVDLDAGKLGNTTPVKTIEIHKCLYDNGAAPEGAAPGRPRRVEATALGRTEGFGSATPPRSRR